LINLVVTASLAVAYQSAKVHMENIIIKNRLMRESNVKAILKERSDLEQDILQI